MSRLQLHDGIAIDTLTNQTIQKAVYMKSGAREIYIGINTLVEIGDFLKNLGNRPGLPEGKE